MLEACARARRRPDRRPREGRRDGAGDAAGRAGRPARDHQRARPAWARTRSSTPCARAIPSERRRLPLRRHLHDPGAAAGRDPGRRRYHFLTEAEFHALHDAGELLEANEVHGNWYGTPRREVAQALAAGRDVILKIDVQGARVVKERVPDALLIFIVPPSLEALFQRLRSRATETADELELRQRNAAIELARQGDYDQVVVNETGEVDRTAARDRGDHRPGEAPQRRPADPDRAEAASGAPWPRRSSCRRGPVTRGRRRAASRSRSTPRPAPGPRTYTYAVPAGARRPRARRGGAGAVRAGGGRRSGSSLGAGGRRARPASELRPVAARVRERRPAAAAARRCASRRAIADRYLAPLAIVIRAMLPPGMLERLELLAEVTPPGGAPAGRAGPRRRRPRPARRAGRPARGRCATSSTPEGRAGLLRAAPGARRRGPARPDWTLLGAGVGPALRAAAVAHARRARPRRRRSPAGSGRPGRPLGPRQVGGARGAGRGRRARRAPRADGARGRRRSPNATARRRSPGSSGAASSRAEVRERPRRPLAGRPAASAAPAPPGRGLTAPRRRPSRSSATPIARRDPTPLLLDGVTGGGKTAIYVEAIAASLERRPAGAPARPRDRPRHADRRPPPGRPRRPRRRSSTRRSARASGPTSGGGSGPATSTSSSAPGLALARAARRRRRRSSSTRSTTPPTRATARRASRPATRRSSWPRLAGAAVVLGSRDARRSRAMGHARAGPLPTRRAARPARRAPSRAVDAVDLRAELAAGNRGLLSGALADGAARPSTPRPATGRSS